MLLLLPWNLAHACKCGGFGIVESWPADGEEGVPPDTHVLVRGEEEATLLVAATDEPVPATVTRREEGNLLGVAIVPDAPLTAFTEYRVASPGDNGDVTFTTGDGEASVVTAAPEVTVLEIVSLPLGRSSCGPDNGVLIGVEPLDGEAHAWWEVALGDTEDLEDPQLRWFVRDTFKIGVEDTCVVSYDVEPREEVWFQVRGIGADGAPGPWSGVGHAELPEASTCGCGTAGSPGGWAGVLLVILAGCSARAREGGRPPPARTGSPPRS